MHTQPLLVRSSPAPQPQTPSSHVGQLEQVWPPMPQREVPPLRMQVLEESQQPLGHVTELQSQPQPARASAMTTRIHRRKVAMKGSAVTARVSTRQTLRPICPFRRPAKGLL